MTSKEQIAFGKVFQKGHKKIMNLAKNQFIQIGFEYAKIALTKAVEDWDERHIDNLTGNTRTGFFAAVFYDGVLADGRKYGVNNNPMTVFDVPGLNVDKPTSGMTRPGESEFRDYSSGEFISRSNESDTHVKEYRKRGARNMHFVYQDDDIGKEVWEEIERQGPSLIPSSTNGLYVMIGNATPYADYLRQTRRANILDERSKRARFDLSRCVRNIVKL